MSEVGVEEIAERRSGGRFELICGLTIAVLAAILAITDLGAGKYGDDEIIGNNVKANSYAWYQSKSVKQSLVEGQRDLLRTLIDSGSVRSEQVETLQTYMKDLEEQIQRYGREKRELLLGSAGVGRENWVQEVDGTYGKVIGAKEWERKVDALATAGDLFDFALLFLQLCLVVGAVSLVLQQSSLKWSFYWAMLGLGIVGIVFSVRAFGVALLVG
jgi:hypothetical protein